MSARCRACNAEITWAITGSGAREPLDAEPVEDGNIEITGQRAVEVNGEWETVPLTRHLKKGEGLTLMEPPPRYKSHFATCPAADKFRRK